MKTKTITIHLERTQNGVTGEVDGEELNLRRSLAFVRHSPDGFEYGYAGSGPAQLAFAILYQACGLDFAHDNYQQFKWDFVSKWKEDVVDETIDISAWCPKQKPEEKP